MSAVEDNNVGAFAAVFLLHEDVAVAETAVGFRVDEDPALLLLHELLVEVEVVGFEDLVAAFVH
jgi:hypothetical protein